jgi:N-methylhydantoinase A
VADEVGIDEIIVPPWPGLFSALGMLLADSRYNYVRGMLDSLANLAEDKIEQQFNSMTREAFQGLDNRKLDRSKALILRALDLRYAGQGYELEIAAPVPFNYVDTVSRFEAEHEAVYGYKHGGGGVEVTALRLTIVLPGRKTKIGTTREGNVKAEDALISHRQIWFTGDWLDAPVYSREHLPPNNTISGPAIVEEYDSTIVIPPDWKCENDTTGCLILRRFGN